MNFPFCIPTVPSTAVLPPEAEHLPQDIQPEIYLKVYDGTVNFIGSSPDVHLTSFSDQFIPEIRMSDGY